MRPSVFALAPLVLAALFLSACGPKPEVDSPLPPPPPPTSGTPDKPIAPVPVAPTKPAGLVDSTGDDPRPIIIIEKLGFAGVRTRMIPHVMGRGWALSVNKPDSIEFQRPAEAELSQPLFGVIPEVGTKVRLRFRLATTAGNNVRIEVCSHLVGRNGPLPYRANLEMLQSSLEDLKTFLSTAPTGGVVIDKVRKK